MIFNNIDYIVLSIFDLDDLYHYKDLRDSIISLVNPTAEKITKTRNLLSQTDLPKKVHQHIESKIKILESLYLG